MNRRWKFSVVVVACLLSLTFTSAPAVAATSTVDSKNPNVILLMLDGVRWQEVFRTDKTGLIFKHLFQDYLSEGRIFGNVDKDQAMTVSNSALLSLPAYQSIMSGETQPCSGNGCGRIGAETFQERAVTELKLDRTQVATIASWDKIPNAVEHVEGATFVNAAYDKLSDGTADAEFDAINEAQVKDPAPWDGARFDRYTWAHSMHFLKKHHPRFMFISFDDSDEWGHKNEWENYLSSLRQYDDWIHELIQTLKGMGEYGAHTTLIITTDHGRGDDSMWGQHGWPWPESKYIWLYVRPAPASVTPQYFQNFNDDGISEAKFSHVDIRPTIEAALGLAPHTCEGCGHAIPRALPQVLSSFRL